MGRTHTCEALILKTYDIGDADRLCVFLTNTHGRIAVVAKGVRKLGSKLGSAVQSFQHLTVEFAEHSSGMYLRSAQCLSVFPSIRDDVQKFALASKGCELLLHFLHDTEPSQEIFTLTREFFRCCEEEVHDLLFPSFQISLLSALGLLPSFEEEEEHKFAGGISDALRSFLCSDASLMQQRGIRLNEQDRLQLNRLCDAMLKEHLSFQLKSIGFMQSVH